MLFKVRYEVWMNPMKGICGDKSVICREEMHCDTSDKEILLNKIKDLHKHKDDLLFRIIEYKEVDEYTRFYEPHLITFED